MRTRISHRQRMLAGATTAVLAAAGLVGLTAGMASAAPSTTVSITAVSPHLVPAGLVDQVITITGKGFTQSTMSGVVISGVGGCTTDPQYIVVSPTTLVLKTVGTDCAAGVSVVTITDASGTAVNPAGAAAALSFTAVPTLATVDSTHWAVTTDNTATLAYADQIATAPVTGGTSIRVLKGAVAFVNTVDAPLKATLGGNPITNIAMPVGGAYFTGTVAAHAAGAVALTVTSGNATTAFTALQTGFAYLGAGLVVAPVSGPAKGGTALTITGVGFTGTTSVTVGGVAATSLVVTATKITCITPAISAGSTDGPVVVQLVGAATPTAFTAGSVFTYLSA